MSARRLAKLFGTFHNISYYAPEMKAFADLGLPEYWRAYMAYRSAPMGIVPPSVVEATFYNFSPSHVQAGIPSAWSTTNPAEVLALRDRAIAAALHRGLGDAPDVHQIAEAADLALPPILACEAGARPLFAAHRELAVPEDPIMRLWFACTLWREHRGDGHNIALAAAEIDGIECHVLLAAKGVGTKEIIGTIRGWSSTAWDQAEQRLIARGLVTATGTFTDAGEAVRSEIEAHTDRLAGAPRALLGDDTDRVLELLEPLVGQLIGSGAVPGRWPPPKVPA
ncbi:MAG: hypothetical protein HOK58_02305 [Acidimicrobiaceae bacterium]|nr:hypothetical protein [Acidimicrobiaceae bacterium]MDG1088938.1 hypothetical protein [Acidimicrobiales bacterium]